ncbi:MAG: hypothetical protein KUG81_07565 [Gammaproteobacteria bacterium]|nr:hypothetical protein [Gammaproteobacteria bacterium]
MSNEKKDFFAPRKEGKPPEEISPVGDYDPSNFDNDLASCGITDEESFTKRHAEFFANLIVDGKKENAVATVARRMEECFSKREIAFLLSKDLLLTAYNKSQELLNKPEPKVQKHPTDGK